MKTFKTFREEVEPIEELSKNLLKRYSKKADAEMDRHLNSDSKTSSSDSARNKFRKRFAGHSRASDKIRGYAKVSASGGPSAAENKKAKDVAHNIAKAHKDLRVTSHGNDHYVHHKDDTDGNEHIHVTHAGKGKVHVTHSGGSKKTLSHADAVKHGHSFV